MTNCITSGNLVISVCFDINYKFIITYSKNHKCFSITIVDKIKINRSNVYSFL